LLPVYKLPVPTGPYEVGTQTFCLEDLSRYETFTENGDDKRKLMVQFWYPAEITDKAELAEYVPGGTDTLNGLANANKLPELLIDYLKYVKSNSYKNANVSSLDAPYPLVILSHGMGTSRFLHTAQAENLASNGFIVAAIDHTYCTTITVFPDGEMTLNSTDVDSNGFDRNIIGKIWSDDIHFVIDQCEQMNAGIIQSHLEGQFDLDNIGVFGHSFGGASAFDSFYFDKRIKSGIDLDGSLFHLDSYSIEHVKESAKPFMFLLSSQQTDIRELYENPTNEVLESMKMTSEEFEEAAKDFLFETEIIKETAKNKGYWISISGTAHYNFTDLPLFSPIIRFTGLSGSIDEQRSHLAINKCILEFFNNSLKNTDGNSFRKIFDAFPELRLH